MKRLLLLLTLFISSTAWAAIPATPVMTLYRFNSALEIPYYSSKNFRETGLSAPVGTLAQGSAVVPCIVVDDGLPLTDSQGVPYVGFQMIMDSPTATPASAEHYRNAVKQRQAMTVANHHCEGGVQYVLDVRSLYAMTKAPFFDPPPRTNVSAAATPPHGELDQIIRTFHNSTYCDNTNRRLTGRRDALQGAWDRFIRDQQNRWSNSFLQRAKHLDYTMRTAIFEGHLERGCNAYGACERNIIALSIRNRGLESCVRRQGCETPGDFQGVSSSISQYNIWDEYLTQISGLTSCFLRDDLAGDRNYSKLQSMYAQNLDDVQRILFGNDQDLAAIFPNNSLSDLKNLKHYYHAPAMGKCFPNHDRVEYMSGAVARRGNNFALIADSRIRVDQKTEGGYFFRNFLVRENPARDVVTVVDNYPGFVVDGRRVTLKAPSRCAPYGILSGCRFNEIGRYRKTPSWINAGKPLELRCRVADQGKTCQEGKVSKTVKVGGVCDTQMRPITGVK
ncbi:MAG: hypothetical protein K0A99_00035 [Desulfoarculaceae bacterium]|nr:hypothetical protein [Desulfoarculaceae bacterium]